MASRNDNKISMKEKKVSGRRRIVTDMWGNVVDGWGNVFSGFRNRSANKAETSYEKTSVTLDTNQLWDLWKSDGYAARVISCVAEDMIRAGFKIVGDTCNSNMTELKSLNIDGVLYEAMCLSRIFGGSGILIGVNDGRRVDQAISVNSIKKVNFLRALPATNIVPVDSSLITDPNDPDYGRYRLYKVRDGVNPNAEGFTVHADRLLLFPWLDGNSVTPYGTVTSYPAGINGKLWGTSVFETIRYQLSDLSLLGNAISNLSQEAVIGKYKIANLADMLASGESDKVRNRIDIINDSKSVINAVLLDAEAGEEYSRDSLTFSGINGVADTMMVFLSGVTGIPVTRLFGRSPAGLDASGESDLTIYYDMISSYQEIMLTSAIQKIVFYVNIYRDSIFTEDTDAQVRNFLNNTEKPIDKIPPKTSNDIHIEWNKLRQMSQKEQADTYFTNAQADMYYKSMGVLSSEEIRRNRFVNGYNELVSVETSALPEEEVEIDNPEEDENDDKPEKNGNKEGDEK